MLLRHAKSDWDDASLPDFARPLAERGRRDAPRMGKALKERGPAPDLIVSSTAARARQTIEVFVKAAGFNITPQFEDAIYGASSAELIHLVRRLPDDRQCALLVGHNPGFEDLVGRLTGVNERMPTAALACIEFQINSWADADYGEGRLAWLLTPKHLKDESED